MRFIWIFSVISLFVILSCGDDCKFNSISTTELPEAKINVNYTAQINVDATCSYAFKETKLLSGSLPPGLSMDGSGAFTGIPNMAGKFNFKIEQKVCFGTNGFDYTDCQTKTKDFSINVTQ